MKSYYGRRSSNRHDNSTTSSTDNEETVVPDSTTTNDKEMIHQQHNFDIGQDVLVKQKDDCYYLGTVVEVSFIREQCLVKFGDNTDKWSAFKEIKKLSTSEQDEKLLCVVCKKSSPKSKREVIVCDKCGRGYHQLCHQPEIPIECQKEDSLWLCTRCVSHEPHRLKKSDKYVKRSSSITPSSTTDVQVSTTKNLPYDLSSLTWDTYHRVNNEHIYCYCGQTGEWYKQMLQCGRCKQWFHERCLDCLQYPLYCGDRFYVFVCSICNHGKEFVRRLELKWVDLVHLMLFNLTAYHSKKYYDLDTTIIPYINDNWHALQLPPKISAVSKSERRENILSILTNNRNRFKCGREIKKRVTIWGLRVRLPPPAPTVSLSFSGPVTEEELRERWQGNRRLQFLSSTQPIDIKYTKKMIPSDNHMKSIMMGTAYQQNNNPSETDSPCPSPEVEQDDNNSNSTASTTTTISSNNSTTVSSNSCNSNNSNFTGTGSTTATTITTSGGSSNSSSSISRIDNEKNNTTTPCDTSGDETSSKSTLDLIIPPPKDFEGKNNPFLTLLRGTSFDGQLNKNKLINNKDTNTQTTTTTITLPLPLTAVIPGKPIMRPTKRQLSEKDIFIGPNGEVKRRRLRRNKSNGYINSITNGTTTSSTTTATTPVTASKTATVVPVKPDNREWKQLTQNSSQQQFDHNFNGRKLRQRPEKNDKDKLNQNNTNNNNINNNNNNSNTNNNNNSSSSGGSSSNLKKEPDINMMDLKSSVNIYFGAANRIAAGEKFTVKAKRIGPTGKMEFLIEWDGPGNGMT